MGYFDERLARALIFVRRPLILLLNAVITSASFLIALILRFDFSFAELQPKLTIEFFVIPLVALIILRATCYYIYRLNQGYWRYVSTHEAVSLFKAHAASSVLFAGALLLLQIKGFPRSIVFIEFALSLLFSAGGRLAVRLLCERYFSKREDAIRSPTQVVIVGGGIAGNLLIKTLLGEPRIQYQPVAIVDDREHLLGSTLHGVKIVGSIGQLGETLERFPRVEAVIVALPTLSQLKFREIEQVCEQQHLPVKRLQSFEHIACQETHEPKTSRTIEEVLHREVNVGHEDEIRDEINGKRVLVTGAGGSIGSELVRQLLTFEPAMVILVEKSEFNLFSIQQELASESPKVSKKFLLADIVNSQRLAKIFENYRPEIVFHAAAYKHVPLLEDNCYEAFVNNILGTRNVLQASKTFGADRFVLISTDKAVDPSSVMGCTKRITELMVAHANLLPPFDNVPSGTYNVLLTRELATAVVRFGNVINSAGSVIPLFRKQILDGGPITVTHPEMERYFMSIREAVRLVLTAGTLGDQGEVYLLDMGHPIKIVDVAKKLRALYGRRDIPIVFSGLRPGEKLTEKLHNAREVRTTTRMKKVFVVHSSEAARDEVYSWVNEMVDWIDRLPDRHVGALIRKFIAGGTELVQPDEGVVRAFKPTVNISRVVRLKNVVGE